MQIQFIAPKQMEFTFIELALKDTLSIKLDPQQISITLSGQEIYDMDWELILMRIEVELRERLPALLDTVIEVLRPLEARVKVISK